MIFCITTFFILFVETFFITVCFSRGRIHLSHFAGGAGGVTLKAFEINPGSLSFEIQLALPPSCYLIRGGHISILPRNMSQSSGSRGISRGGALVISVAGWHVKSLT